MTGVVLVGRGRIGGEIARGLAGNALPPFRLLAVLGRGDDIASAAANADIVVEAAAAAAVPAIARAVLPLGKTLVVGSAAGLWLPDMPPVAPGRVIVPSGAAPALDALKAFARHGDCRARFRMLGPPGHSPAGPEGWRGSVREAALRFPAHCNNLVAAALALGREDIAVEIRPDPAARGPTVEIEVESDTSRLTARLEHFASPAHPQVTRNIALSMLAALASLAAPITAGT